MEPAGAGGARQIKDAHDENFAGRGDDPAADLAQHRFIVMRADDGVHDDPRPGIRPGAGSGGSIGSDRAVKRG